MDGLSIVGAVDELFVDNWEMQAGKEAAGGVEWIVVDESGRVVRRLWMEGSYGGGGGKETAEGGDGKK